MRLIVSVANRFWAKVSRGSGCWTWTGSNSGSVGYRKPYGSFWFRGAMVGAHRIAWELEKGQIPPGLFVLHRCDATLCVRPSHLFLGSQKDNIQDCVTKGRLNPARGDRHGLRRHPERRAWGDRNGTRLHPECLKRGEENPSAKLTWAGVAEIRRRFGSGESQPSLARRFGVSRPTIWEVLNGKTWRGP